jgi:hypothetical protein
MFGRQVCALELSRFRPKIKTLPRRSRGTGLNRGQWNLIEFFVSPVSAKCALLMVTTEKPILARKGTIAMDKHIKRQPIIFCVELRIGRERNNTPMTHRRKANIDALVS